MGGLEAGCMGTCLAVCLALIIFLTLSFKLSARRHSLASLPIRSSSSVRSFNLEGSLTRLASLLSIIMASLFLAS